MRKTFLLVCWFMPEGILFKHPMYRLQQPYVRNAQRDGLQAIGPSILFPCPRRLGSIRLLRRMLSEGWTGGRSYDCRLRKGGADSSCANLRLYGHTSWEMYRQNRCEIALGTGARTLSAFDSQRLSQAVPSRISS